MENENRKRHGNPSKGFAEKMFISGVFMPSEIEMKFNSEKSKRFIDCVNFGAKAKYY